MIPEMKAETKEFIETHIDMIENNGIGSTYLDCPLRILDDFNKSMQIAGIEYPPEIHNYVVVCCYVSNYFEDVRLQHYDFEYSSEKEEYRFVCENCLYDRDHFQQRLAQMLPKRKVTIDTRTVLLYTGESMLKIRVEVD